MAITRLVSTNDSKLPLPPPPKNKTEEALKVQTVCARIIMFLADPKGVVAWIETSSSIRAECKELMKRGIQIPSEQSKEGLSDQSIQGLIGQLSLRHLMNQRQDSLKIMSWVCNGNQDDPRLRMCQALLMRSGRDRIISVDNAVFEAAKNGDATVIEGVLQGVLEGIKKKVLNQYTQSWQILEDLNSALSGAARGGDESLVRVLLETTLPYPLMVTSDSLNSALSGAARGGHESLVTLLLGTTLPNGDTVNESGLNSALLGAAQGGHESVVRFLLETTLPNGLKFNKTYLNWAFSAAARGGHESIVRVLLETTLPNGDTLTEQGLDWALEAAAQGGHESLVRFLKEIQSQHKTSLFKRVAIAAGLVLVGGAGFAFLKQENSPEL